MRDFTKTRFDDGGEPSSAMELPNLADLMLVFAVGVIAALAANGGATVQRTEVEMGPELAQLPTSADAQGEGLEAVGRVYRDPETGKLYVVE